MSIVVMRLTVMGMPMPMVLPMPMVRAVSLAPVPAGMMRFRRMRSSITRCSPMIRLRTMRVGVGMGAVVKTEVQPDTHRPQTWRRPAG